MNEEKFENANALKEWLIRQGAEVAKAGSAATTLFPHGFDLPSTLIGISSANLQTCGLSIAAAQHLSNMLKDVVVGDVKPPPTKRSKQTFDMQKCLFSPLQEEPPIQTEPKFVCNVDWQLEVKSDIENYLALTDNQDDRVPPMALVRCSRGGKTRALLEIAKMMHQEERDGKISTLYVSFNDISTLLPKEQKNPLRALCWRIAYMASHDRKSEVSFLDFQSYYCDIEPGDIVEWLGDTPAILLVDELNNLEELTREKSSEAMVFCQFIKQNFLAREGRYFVFSSHVLTTLGFFGEFVDLSC